VVRAIEVPIFRSIHRSIHLQVENPICYPSIHLQIEHHLCGGVDNHWAIAHCPLGHCSLNECISMHKNHGLIICICHMYIYTFKQSINTCTNRASLQWVMGNGPMRNGQCAMQWPNVQWAYGSYGLMGNAYNPIANAFSRH